jgi:hypothetical protein
VSRNRVISGTATRIGLLALIMEQGIYAAPTVHDVAVPDAAEDRVGSRFWAATIFSIMALLIPIALISLTACRFPGPPRGTSAGGLADVGEPTAFVMSASLILLAAGPASTRRCGTRSRRLHRDVEPTQPNVSDTIGAGEAPAACPTASSRRGMWGSRQHPLRRRVRRGRMSPAPVISTVAPVSLANCPCGAPSLRVVGTGVYPVSNCHGIRRPTAAGPGARFQSDGLAHIRTMPPPTRGQPNLPEARIASTTHTPARGRQASQVVRAGTHAARRASRAQRPGSRSVTAARASSPMIPRRDERQSDIHRRSHQGRHEDAMAGRSRPSTGRASRSEATQRQHQHDQTGQASVRRPE